VGRSRRRRRIHHDHHVRRVATFSLLLHSGAVRALRPDIVVLTFCDYLHDAAELDALISLLSRVQAPTHLTFGPYPWDLVPTGLGHAAMERLRNHYPAADRPPLAEGAQLARLSP
jgi:hypothetical protein